MDERPHNTKQANHHSGVVVYVVVRLASPALSLFLSVFFFVDAFFCFVSLKRWKNFLLLSL
jgi:hypothetical protein